MSAFGLVRMLRSWCLGKDAVMARKCQAQAALHQQRSALEDARRFETALRCETTGDRVLLGRAHSGAVRNFDPTRVSLVGHRAGGPYLGGRHGRPGH